MKDDADRFGDDRIKDLPLGHLMAPHQVKLQLAEGGAVEMSQVANPRHGRLFTKAHATLARARDHRTVVRD